MPKGLRCECCCLLLVVSQCVHVLCWVHNGNTKDKLSSWPSISTSVPKCRIRMIPQHYWYCFVLYWYRSIAPLLHPTRSAPFQPSLLAQHPSLFHSRFAPLTQSANIPSFAQFGLHAVVMLSLIAAEVLMTLHTDCKGAETLWNVSKQDRWTLDCQQEKAFTGVGLAAFSVLFFSDFFSSLHADRFWKRKKKSWQTCGACFVILSSASAPTWAKIATVCYHQIHSPPFFLEEKITIWINACLLQNESRLNVPLSIEFLCLNVSWFA